MRFTACDCGVQHYGRAQRASWMKLLWTRRLYHCASCEQSMLLSPGDVAERLAHRDRKAGRRSRPAQVAVERS
jgi:hypothetical protein